MFYVAGVIPHDLLQCFELADVNAKWLMELSLHDGTWLMLLPSGWWNCHCRVVVGWCYGQQADVICLGQFYNFSSEMLNRTSSQICGRWYLPMFLFRDGSLTLIYRASLMVLMRFWSSLPTISKFSILMLWSVVLWWSNMRDGAFWCSLNLCQKVLEDSPIYSSSLSTLSHL